LTDQVRRSSGSVGAQIAEAWGKRDYERHFISKMTDADSEQLETQHWLMMAKDRKYITEDQARELIERCQTLGKMINGIIAKSDRFCRRP
jgi:four helix bundle protein